MSTKSAYLTIDDSPGRDFARKAKFLHERNVPAIFFCIGSKLDEWSDEVVGAIQNGFLIGNHSFSHPHFSDLSVEEGRVEISRTDQTIEALYSRAGVLRPGKYFRFPFFDVGGHSSGADYESKWSKPEAERMSFPNHQKRVAFQRHLRTLGYRQPAFENINLKYFHDPALLTDLDVKCTFNQLEYHFGRPEAPWGLSSPETILARIDEDFPFEGRSQRCLDTSDIVLIHDHDETSELFYRSVERYLEVGIAFREIPPGGLNVGD